MKLSDAISREDLQDKFDNYCPHIDCKKCRWYSLENSFHKCALIDNAQPVPLPDFKAGYKQAILDGIINFSKQKGEWVPINPDCRGYPEYFKCSICGAHIYTSSAEKELDYNGCPYCFADMRGEEE